ncbi:hypothetical protein DFP73DRAFT_559481 [Morchella snyderi]|nr:hypothetical protein DFP73DRAFT_559481 [Morchella snyderi]
MPLLALPRDILFEILDRLWEDAQVVDNGSDGNNGCEGFTSGHRSMIWVGETCRALRTAALPYIYSDVALSSKNGVLCKFLDEYKCLTTYVRKITFIYSDIMDIPLRSVILHCTRLRQLRIQSYYETPSGYPELMILKWLPSESKQSLEYLEIKTDLKSLLRCSQELAKWSAVNDFCKLQDLKLYSHYTDEVLDIIPNEARSEILPQVRKLWLGISTKEPERVGPYFAKMLPNVESLYLDVPRNLVYTIMNTYIDLKSNITVLQINGNFADGTPIATEPYHLCELIPKISRKLTKFTISTDMVFKHSPFCHHLFKDIDDWPLLVELNLEAAMGCVGLRPDLLHSAITELARTRPEARMLLKQSSDIIVNCRPKGPKYIAPVEIFEGLCKQSISSIVQLHPEFSDGDESDDEQDFEHDIEDEMEGYFDDYDDDYYEEEEYDDFWVE